MELGHKKEGNESFSVRPRELLGERAQVSTLQAKSVLEFRDLDCLTTTEEVQEAIKGALPDLKEEVKVPLIKSNSRALKMAIVEIEDKFARSLLNTGRIKIGWISSRMRKRSDVVRCHRRFGYGHHQAKCTDPDRKKGLCIKCGQKGHIKKDCSNQARCFVCRGETGRERSYRSLYENSAGRYAPK